VLNLRKGTMEKQSSGLGKKIKLVVEIGVLVVAAVYLPMRLLALKYTNDATRCYNAGRVEEAMTGYEQALKVYPGFPPARRNLCEACLEQADKRAFQTEYTEAERLYEKAMSLDADANDVHRKLATVYWHQGKRIAALAEIDEHLKRKPTDRQALDLQRALTKQK
jgi:tetratricopeptide (TPR) repeat protein